MARERPTDRQTTPAERTPDPRQRRPRQIRRPRSGNRCWLLDGERLDHIMTCAIVDTAHIVTTHALAVGDLGLARFAAETSVEPRRMTTPLSWTWSPSTEPQETTSARNVDSLRTSLRGLTMTSPPSTYQNTQRTSVGSEGGTSAVRARLGSKMSGQAEPVDARQESSTTLPALWVRRSAHSNSRRRSRRSRPISFSTFLTR